MEHSKDKIDDITLDDSERQPCEVWTRVMGYHRPTSAFNPGKHQEHLDRLYFQEFPVLETRVETIAEAAEQEPEVIYL